ncbi:MAG: GldG family protein [Thermoanaerobaculia bacterium]
MSGNGGKGWRGAVASGSLLSAGVLLVAALVAIVNYVGMRFYHRFDWTSSQIYSLSEKTGSILAGLDKEIDVTMFLPAGSPLHDSAKELLERYAAKSPKIHYRAIEADKNLIEAQRLVDKFQLSSLNVVVFESGTDRRVVEESALADYDYSAIQYGGAPEMTGFKGEEAFTGAILELAESRKPKVLLTSGHGEASIDETGSAGLSGVRDLVGKENVELANWESLGQPDVPQGTDLLVVAGAKTRFVEPELAAFGRYLDHGGRMLVLLDPELAPGGGVLTTGLESWLSAYGVEVGANIVVDPGATVPLYGAETLFAGALGGHPIVRSLEQAKVGVIVALARSIGAGKAPEGMASQVLLQTTADGWGESDLANLKAVAKDAKDMTGPVPLAVAVSARSNETPLPDVEEDETAAPPPPVVSPADAPKWRLVVVGDTDFASNSLLTLSGNPTMLSNTFNWLLDRQKLLGIGPKKPEQVRMTLTPGQLSGITWLVLAGMPALAIAAGIAVYLRRRR